MGDDLRQSGNERSATPAAAGGDTVAFVKSVTATIVGSSDESDLFHRAFREFASKIPIDLGVALLVEQSLNVHLTRRAGLERIVDEAFAARVRGALRDEIDVPLEADLVIQSETSALPGESSAAPLEHVLHTRLELGGRVHGLLFVSRGGLPFETAEQERLDLVALQCSIVLGAIRSYQRMQNLADSDDLTGIWNRRYFRRQLPIEVERARIYNLPLAMLLFDIDDFKLINDRHGHAMGDVVLSEVCGMIRAALRPPDLFARFGGDEFAIVLPHTDLAGAITVADRIVERVRALRVTPHDGDAVIHPTISVGVAVYVAHDQGAAELVERADDRLYNAKRLGKDRYSF